MQPIFETDQMARRTGDDQVRVHVQLQLALQLAGEQAEAL
jgi:hypothetical protein